MTQLPSCPAYTIPFFPAFGKVQILFSHTNFDNFFTTPDISRLSTNLNIVFFSDYGKIELYFLTYC